MGVTVMRHNTLHANEIRDLIIGGIALMLAILIWGVIFIPAAV